ncbi:MULTISPECIES: cell division protein FtsA [Fusobacterium]|jgi:cell division protein ftsA|nr:MULTISPECIES: cell division protein FtsA [Fusobacterium]EFD80951.1 cell division protein FtsA [Fusobacterium animalis D11]AGM24207.1 cell division protein FtsA [Fusobacterium animalis 4_8]ALF17126.1 cell division protein FtsA [Fusobacterium animalis]ASG30012.1 cell division protein FtsA [Fusobacterium animalis]EEO43209.1 cell division protein FtsA [Fusobacterium animalis 7_1]
MKDDVIKKVALDIGNNGIKLLVGEMSSDFQRISVTNYVKTKSKGISKSLIENPEALAETLREAIGKAESIESPITKLSLALGGPGILSATVNVKSSFPEKEIEKTDMDNLLRQAKRQIFKGREGQYRILYKEVYNKKLDNSGIVRQPIGMVGKELQADIHLVYVDDSYVQKFIQVVNKIGIDIDRIYLNSYASAKGTLDEETKKMGVAHVDIGYGSTSIVILKSGKVLYAKTKPIGEMHYISDLSIMLKIPKEGAEEILKKLKNKQVEADNTIRYGAKKVTLREIKDIILARTGDIINFIGSAIDESGFNGVLAKGIVLTGGAVEIEGVAEQIATRSGYLTRKMLPIPLKGLKDAFYSDAVVIGVFLEDMEREYKASIEETKEANKVKKEKIKEETTSNNKINDKKMDRKEEIDNFLGEIEEVEPEKEEGKIRKVIRWFGELF